MKVIASKKFVGVVLTVNSPRGEFLAIGFGSKKAAKAAVGA